MFKRVSWDEQAIGRRIVDRLARSRARLCPSIVPEIMAWLRMQGNRYVELLSGMESRYAVKGDAFMNHVRQTTEFRLALIQDLICLTCDEFPLKKWWEAIYTTAEELGITEQDMDPSLFLPTETYEEGAGI